MATTPLKSFCSRLLTRGERGVAAMGVAMTVVLLLCFAANVWLNDLALTASADAQQADQLKATGPLLAETARRLIAANDLMALRQLVAGTALSLRLGECSVQLGEGRIVADRMPGRVNTLTTPAQWSGSLAAEGPAADEPSRMRFPFDVEGRGVGFVDLAPLPIAPAGASRFLPSGLVCAVALGVLVLVYRRSRQNLVELDVINGALIDAKAGETSAAALQVDAKLGESAAAWNAMIGELDTLRRRVQSGAAATAAGSRRAGGGGLELACDAMAQGIVLIDDQMRVRFCNGAACTFLNFDRATLSGMAAAELLPDAKFGEAIRAVSAGKLRRPTVIELEQAPDAGGAVLRVFVRPVRRGDADAAMIIIEDVTQQRMAEKARNSFISQVTHELRTPLTNIRLYAETAIEDGGENTEVRANCLNVINQESRRLERIVSEMLSVAEIEAGSTTIRREEVYVDVLMNEMRRDYQAQATDKQIELAFNVSPKLPKLEADKDKLTLAIHNLIGNALKYTPAGGKVTVTADVRDGCFAVDVADTGIGIEPAEAEKVFDRFFRSADPRVGKIVGTGLGLTLAREVMRLHGGDVTLESQINRGSTFTATVPVAMAA